MEERSKPPETIPELIAKNQKFLERFVSKKVVSLDMYKRTKDRITDLQNSIKKR